MKVIKHLDSIPSEFWGKVIDDCTNLIVPEGKAMKYEYHIKDTDTFPLPKKFDKVTVGGRPFTHSFICYDIVDDSFLVKNNEGNLFSCNYVQPVIRKSYYGKIVRNLGEIGVELETLNKSLYTAQGASERLQEMADKIVELINSDKS